MWPDYRKQLIAILTILLLFFISLLLFWPTLFGPSTVKEEIPVLEVEPEISIPLPPVAEELPEPVIEVALEEPEPPVVEPEAPVLIEETIIPPPVIEPEVEEVPVWPIEDSFFFEEDDYDPWADFYTGDDDAFFLFEEDESYYVPLFVNLDYSGDIETTFGTDDTYINGDELSRLIGSLLVPEARELLFNSESEIISFAQLHEMEIETYFDYQMFELYLEIPTAIMPMRFLSVTSRSPSRVLTYQLSGAEELAPSRFSLYSNFFLYSAIDLRQNDTGVWQYSLGDLFNAQVSSSMSIGNLAFDFNFSIGLRRAYMSVSNQFSSDFRDYFSFQGIQGFYDVIDKSTRIVFGNVNDYLGLSASSFGIALEKRYSFGTATPQRHQFQQELTIEEPSKVTVFINEKSVYQRLLQPGIYRLRDFAFSQGANEIRIEVEPESNPEALLEYHFNLGYDSALMARGDTLYALSFTLNSGGYGLQQFTEDLFQGNWSSIKDATKESVRNFSARAFLKAGLSDEFTGSVESLVTLNSIHFNLLGTLATMGGTINGRLKPSYDRNRGFNLDLGLSHGVSFKEDAFISSISSSLDISSAHTLFSGKGAISTSVSLAARITELMRVTVNGALDWQIGNYMPTWRLSASTGYSFWKAVALSVSVNVDAPQNEKVRVSGRIAASYSPIPALGFVSTTSLSPTMGPITDETIMSFSFRPRAIGNHSLQMGIHNIIPSSPLDHVGSLSYTLNTRAFGLAFRPAYSDRFRRLSASLSLNTALAYANGLVGITRTIPENFLLVKAKGELAREGVTVTKAMASQPEQLPQIFGVSTFTAISPYVKNSAMIHANDSTAVGNVESFIYEFAPRPRQGFALRITGEPTYSVVSTLLQSDKQAYSRYTAPVGKVVLDEFGEEYIEEDESLYLFTDEHGFYLVTGLAPGEYEIEVYLPRSSEEDLPLRLRFEVTVDASRETSRVLILETFNAERLQLELEEEGYAKLAGEMEADESYILAADGSFHLEVVQRMNDEEFWDSYYPQRIGRDAVTLADEDEYYTYVIADPEPNALQKMRTAQDPILAPLAQLRRSVLPHLQSVLPAFEIPLFAEQPQQPQHSQLLTEAP